jgi:hypothetical protein
MIDDRTYDLYIVAVKGTVILNEQLQYTSLLTKNKKNQSAKISEIVDRNTRRS